MARKLSVTVAHPRPISGNLLAQESERRIGEAGAGRVALVVGDIPVHHAPQPLDRVEVRGNSSE